MCDFLTVSDDYTIDPCPADHDYCRFYYVLRVFQVTDIGNKMCVWTLGFAKDRSQIKQI